MTFSLARLFGYTKLLEAELERERIAHAETKRQAEEKERSLIDAIQRNANKLPVFEKPAPPKTSNVPAVAFGPTMSARRQQAKEAEMLEKAVAASNGHKVDVPEIPSE
jgi:hypothetical protein